MEITGHRGAAGLYPENTVKGFLKAAELGCNAVEMDVRLTKDKRAVLMHDERIDRTTNGKGFVSDYTISELKSFRVYKSEPIPSLEEVLENLKDLPLRIQIELKGPETEKLVPEIIDFFGITKKTTFTSFYHRRVKYVTENYPGAKGGLLIGSNPVDPVCILNSAHAEYLHINFRLIDERIVEAVHRAGKKIITWGSVEDFKAFKKLVVMGVDAVGSNRPDLLLGYLKRI
ncbi:MAG: hypothetical protein J7K04_09430 [Spirochaetales bacterium]|nr:hypothetical protein [Spirochaetales bacterium]